MRALECVSCGRPVTDLAGDVVIDRADAEAAGIGRMKVVCDACHADPVVAAKDHTMWGLAWLRGHYVAVTRGLLTGGLPAEAAEEFAGLGYILLPGQSREGSDPRGTS